MKYSKKDRRDDEQKGRKSVAGDRKSSVRKSYGEKDENRKTGIRKTYGERGEENRKSSVRKSYGEKDENRKTGIRKSYGEREDNRKSSVRKSYGERGEENRKSGTRKTYGERPIDFREKEERKSTRTPKVKSPGITKKDPNELIRLNRFISNSGVCSRRKADELILKGEVSVNGEVVKELGFKVKLADKIKFQGKLLKPGKLEYILLNKPKDYITTTDDPMERRTVMDLVRNASTERVYPVGRLDRNTTGLLLLTNDGDLADKLAHPRNQVRKIYEVELDKSLITSDFEKIKNGFELEDGLAKVDEISYIDGKSKKHVGVELHIGRNRIVRRIFESLGYEVVKLDRVVYAGLTKKDLPRGRFRHLTKEEIVYLKHLNKY